MSHKATYTIILILLVLGIFFIILVASLVIRKPTLISSDNQTQVSWTLPVTIYTGTEPSVLPVFTATSIVKSPQSGKVQESATSQEPINPTDTPINTPAPTLIHSEIPENKSGFCGTNGKKIVLSFTIEPKNNDDNVSIPLLRYVLFDFDNRTIRILSLPNSLIVSGKTIETLNLSNPSLNDLYNYTINNLSLTDLIAEDVGANMLARVLFEQLGIVPDYWVVLYTRDVVKIIEQFDPVLIQVNSENISYNASQLWELLSQSNLVDQDKILRLMINRLHETAMLDKIPILTSLFQDLSYSDIDRQMYLNLICALENTSTENIQFVINDQFLLENGNAHQAIDRSEMILWVKREFLDR
jgi:hypothetical protein